MKMAKTPIGQRQNRIDELEYDNNYLRERLRKTENESDQYGERMQERDEEYAAASEEIAAKKREESAKLEAKKREESTKEFRFNQLGEILRKYYKDDEVIEIPNGTEMVGGKKSDGSQADYHKFLLRGSTPDAIWGYSSGDDWHPNYAAGEGLPRKFENGGEDKLGYHEVFDNVKTCSNNGTFALYDGAHYFAVRGKDSYQEIEDNVNRELQTNGRRIVKTNMFVYFSNGREDGDYRDPAMQDKIRRFQKSGEYREPEKDQDKVFAELMSKGNGNW
jgi:hypothetical protein